MDLSRVRLLVRLAKLVLLALVRLAVGFLVVSLEVQAAVHLVEVEAVALAVVTTL